MEIFEPLVQDILNLVTKQIEATKARDADVKAIMMVGGFGENSYLHKRLREAVRARGIGVWKTPDGYVYHLYQWGHGQGVSQLIDWLTKNRWTAVARGALMKGLAKFNKRKEIVDGRKARDFYGTESSKPFDVTIHPIEQR